MAIVKKAFSIDDQLASELDSFVKNNFGTAKDALNFMLAAAKTQVAKTDTNREAEISNVQNLLTQLSTAFVSSWSYNSNAENRIKSDFEAKLKEADALHKENTETIETLKSELLCEGKKYAEAIEALKSETEKAKAELAEAKAEIEKIKADSANSSKLISVLEEAKSKLETENKALQSCKSEADALKAEIEKLKQERYEFAQQIRKEAFTEFQELVKMKEPVKKTVRKTATADNK